MISAWLDLPTPAMLAVLALFYTATAGAVFWLSFGRPCVAYAKTFSGVVAPFFSSVAILFGLLTGFLANDVGDRSRQANRTVLAESDGLRSTHTLSVASAADLAKLREAMRIYVASVLAEEWPKMAERGGAAATEAALTVLLREAAQPRIAAEAGQAAHNALLAAVGRVRTARSDRLAIGLDRTNDLKWGAILLLGIITQIAVGLVHLDRPRPQIAALTVFTLGVVVSLGLIALQEHPYDGLFRTSPDPISHVLASMNAAN